jgi:hypothetical protein
VIGIEVNRARISDLFVDRELKRCGFTSVEPLEVYRSAKDIFESASFQSLKHWENRVVVFQDGKSFVRKGKIDSSYSIQCVLNRALSTKEISFQDKVVFFNGINTIFKAHKWDFTQIPVNTIRIKEKGRNIYNEIMISILISNQIPKIKDILCKEPEEVVYIELPSGYLYKNFIDFLVSIDNPNTITELSWLDIAAVFQIAHYFFDNKTPNKCLNYMIDMGFISLQEIPIILDEIHLLDSEFANQFFSLMLNNHIFFRIKDGDSIHTICNDLVELESFRDHIEDLSINLDLQGLSINEDDLLSLETILSDVHFLDISGTRVKQLPPVWGKTLSLIDIGHTDITSIPQGFEVLETLLANSASKLEDISALDNLSTLKFIDISETAVKSLPKGYSSLEDFILV